MSSVKIPGEIAQNAEFRLYESVEGEDVYWFHRVVSTMDTACGLIKNGSAGIIAADEQTCGRGRYGKSWFSLPGGLYFSWITREEERFPFFLSELVTLSLVETMSSFGIICNIKLPNDIITCDKKKLAGILIEKKGEFYNIGVGINVNNRMDVIETGISMSMLLGRPLDDRTEILKRFISRFHINKKNFSEKEEFYLGKWSVNLIK
ncbi:MAG TPA: biotin--[acetyl-CoA-carboxylase] ligase [bacterium]|nr:biotin--[acetyl-CoA-carboxylase] ligase [bacterium]